MTLTARSAGSGKESAKPASPDSNPAVHVAIVGTRNAAHIDNAIAAADLELDPSALRRIEDIISEEVRVGGPSPESV
jgi:diketogulonate reductase-like aldo/keto reductase